VVLVHVVIGSVWEVGGLVHVVIGSVRLGLGGPQPGFGSILA
jgi:hypothetical protein